VKEASGRAAIGGQGLKVAVATGLLVATLGVAACGGDSSDSASDQAKQQIQDQANQLKDQATESAKQDASEAVDNAADQAQQAIDKAKP